MYLHCSLFLSLLFTNFATPLLLHLLSSLSAFALHLEAHPHSMFTLRATHKTNTKRASSIAATTYSFSFSPFLPSLLLCLTTSSLSAFAAACLAKAKNASYLAAEPQLKRRCRCM